MTLEHSSLGRTVIYLEQYAPQLLFPLPRSLKREEIGINESLPFKGIDVWNGYELSWLNGKGKPVVAIAQFLFPCESPNLVESKSFKLYLNSFNQTIIPGTDAESFTRAEHVMTEDLTNVVGAPVTIILMPLNSGLTKIYALEGECLDNLDISCDEYDINVNYLRTEDKEVSEIVYSNLLKSNCLITGQPDWGSVQIEYTGKKIAHEDLLRYLVSFRRHNEFHEHCVERIFTDIMHQCQPQKLTVQAFYTRRGGLDINPLRSTENFNFFSHYKRLVRQ